MDLVFYYICTKMFNIQFIQNAPSHCYATFNLIIIFRV